MAMGAADVVPGVSGGTIAFITGIYEELLKTISNFNFKALKVWKEKGFSAFWKEINGTFLVVLVAGIITSLLSLAKLINYLLIHQPILVWSFFFGLIVASIYYIGKQIQSWNFSAILGILIGTLTVVFISILPPMSSSDSVWFLFISGFLASTAMILPGISGSFILLILGSYSMVIGAISQISTNPTYALSILAPVGFGVVAGLLVSSKTIYYLLQKFENFMMALLTGFLVGSLYKVWPWKETLLIFNKESKSPIDFSKFTDNQYHSATAYLKNNPDTDTHIFKILTERNISPQTYEMMNINTSPNIALAILCAFIGFSLIFIIEFVAKKKDV